MFVDEIPRFPDLNRLSSMLVSQTYRLELPRGCHLHQPAAINYYRNG
jgi:hypothetical protein